MKQAWAAWLLAGWAGGGWCANTATMALSGDLRLDYYRSSKRFDQEQDFWGVAAQLQHALRLEEHWETRLDLRVQAPDLVRESDAATRWIEAYVRWHAERSRWTVGRQIVAWGRADALNPTDNLSPRDYAVRLPFEEDQRFGAAGARWDFFADPQTTWTGYASPEMSPHRLALPPDLPAVERRPGPGRWTAAGKLDHRGEVLDWSVSLLRGFSLTPELRAPDLARTPELSYPRIRVLGADAAYNAGRWAWRGEVARILRDEADPSGVGMRSHWSAVVGADRNFDDGWNLNVQIVAKWGDAIVAGQAAEQALADFNALTFGQQRARLLGYTARLGREWGNQVWKAELAVVGYAGAHPSSMLRPMLTYAVSDAVRMTVGGEWVQGTAQSYFGSVKGNQGAFAEWRLSF